jgi:hypothetical protein
MGMGISMASSGALFNDKHPAIGITLFVVLFFQGMDGLLHHANWVKAKNNRKRTLVTYVHMWTGRVAILVGMVNGGFGLQLAGVHSKGKIAGYGVVAGISFTCLVVAIVYGERKRLAEEKAEKEEREREAQTTSAFE